MRTRATSIAIPPGIGCSHAHSMIRTLKTGVATERSNSIRCHVCGQIYRRFKDSCFRCQCRFHEDSCGTSVAERPGHTRYYCQQCYTTLTSMPIASEDLVTFISSIAHVHATEQDLQIQRSRREENLTTTATEKGFVPFATMLQGSLETQARGASHAHENGPGQYEYQLLLHWARSRPVARVYMATVAQRRACKGLRATWTLQCMTQLCRFDQPGCRGCGHYPTSSTCNNCSTAWCSSCRVWSALCWKCYRPRYSLADTGEFVAGFGGPGGDGSFDTPL